MPRPLLTARQLEVLQLVALDLQYKQVGQRLWIERTSVRNHMVNIRRILKAPTRKAAVTKARQLGLLEEPAPCLCSD